MCALPASPSGAVNWAVTWKRLPSRQTARSLVVQVKLCGAGLSEPAAVSAAAGRAAAAANARSARHGRMIRRLLDIAVPPWQILYTGILYTHRWLPGALPAFR